MKNQYEGKTFKLKELPSHYFPTFALTVGKEYLIKYQDGCCFCIEDDLGDSISLNMQRFEI